MLDEESIRSVNLSGKNINSLLYADDLVLLSDDQKGLQNKLDILDKYCKDWCLEINTTRLMLSFSTKVVTLLMRRFTLRMYVLTNINI